MKTVVLDANVIVRYVLGDNPKLSLEARDLIEKNKFYLDEVILAEVIWVLGSVYGKTSKWIASVMKKFVSMNRVTNPRKGKMIEALGWFEKKNLNYIDCWIWVMSRDLGLELATQDKKLNEFIKSKNGKKK